MGICRSATRPVRYSALDLVLSGLLLTAALPFLLIAVVIAIVFGQVVGRDLGFLYPVLVTLMFVLIGLGVRACGRDASAGERSRRRTARGARVVAAAGRRPPAPTPTMRHRRPLTT